MRILHSQWIVWIFYLIKLHNLNEHVKYLNSCQMLISVNMLRARRLFLGNRTTVVLRVCEYYSQAGHPTTDSFSSPAMAVSSQILEWGILELRCADGIQTWPTRCWYLERGRAKNIKTTAFHFQCSEEIQVAHDRVNDAALIIIFPFVQKQCNLSAITQDQTQFRVLSFTQFAFCVPSQLMAFYWVHIPRVTQTTLNGSYLFATGPRMEKGRGLFLWTRE